MAVPIRAYEEIAEKMICSYIREGEILQSARYRPGKSFEDLERVFDGKLMPGNFARVIAQVVERIKLILEIKVN